METSVARETRSGEENPSRILPVHLTPNFGMKFLLRGKSVTSQHVGQPRGKEEVFCSLYMKLRDFFALFKLKPKKDRSLSSRGKWYNLRSEMEFDMISFDHVVRD
jgi:hypothetical protein